jgi:FixJ family two-component response regulator
MSSDFTIFLIDDDPAVLKSLDRLPQAAGYETKAYLSAETFLSEHDPSTPGCILLDLVMPGLNGLDLQEVLTRKGIDRPVIFLTGRASIPDSVQAMREGAIDFLTKPVDTSELLSAIKSAEERDKTQRHITARRNVVLEKSSSS